MICLKIATMFKLVSSFIILLFFYSIKGDNKNNELNILLIRHTKEKHEGELVIKTNVSYVINLKYKTWKDIFSSLSLIISNTTNNNRTIYVIDHNIIGWKRFVKFLNPTYNKNESISYQISEYKKKLTIPIYDDGNNIIKIFSFNTENNLINSENDAIHLTWKINGNDFIFRIFATISCIMILFVFTVLIDNEYSFFFHILISIISFVIGTIILFFLFLLLVTRCVSNRNLLILFPVLSSFLISFSSLWNKEIIFSWEYIIHKWISILWHENAWIRIFAIGSGCLSAFIAFHITLPHTLYKMIRNAIILCCYTILMMYSSTSISISLLIVVSVFLSMKGWILKIIFKVLSIYNNNEEFMDPKVPYEVHTNIIRYRNFLTTEQFERQGKEYTRKELNKLMDSNQFKKYIMDYHDLSN